MKPAITKTQFEDNVLIFACLLGFVRSFLAVVGDLEDLEIHADFVTDLSFTVLFLLTLIGLRFLRSNRWIIGFFYIPFLVILIVSFISAGGLISSTEHNIFAGLVLVNFTLRDKYPLYFSMGLILATLVSLLYLEHQHAYLVSYEDNHGGDLNFIFASIGIIGLTYYAKNIFSSSRKKLKENYKALEQKARELTEKNQFLVKQKNAIEGLTLELDKKVLVRTNELKNIKARREKYLHITLNQLTEKCDQTISSINRVRDKTEKDFLVDMIIESGKNLQKEIVELKAKLDGDTR